MPEQPDRLQEHLSSLAAAIDRMKDAASQMFLAGEVQRFRFDGKAGITSVMDDRGSSCLSYAVYNPNEFEVFVALAGASATKEALVIPKQKLVVAPLTINGHVELAVDPEEIEEGAGAIIRVRFPNPQAFFVGALV